MKELPAIVAKTKVGTTVKVKKQITIKFYDSFHKTFLF